MSSLGPLCILGHTTEGHIGDNTSTIPMLLFRHGEELIVNLYMSMWIEALPWRVGIFVRSTLTRSIDRELDSPPIPTVASPETE